MTVRGRRAATLLELVVAAIIAMVLASVAVASYVAVTSKVKDTSSKAALNAVAAAEEQLWLRYGSFSPAGADLTAAEGAYTYVSGASPSTRSGEVSVSISSDGEAVGLATLTPSGTCVTVRHYQPHAAVDLTDSSGVLAAAGVCTGDQALTVEGKAW